MIRILLPFIFLAIFLAFLGWVKHVQGQTCDPTQFCPDNRCAPYASTGCISGPSPSLDVVGYEYQVQQPDGSWGNLGYITGRLEASFDLDDPSLGGKKVRVRAKDAAGNVSEWLEGPYWNVPKVAVVPDFPEPPPQPNIPLEVTALGTNWSSNKFPVVHPFALEVGALVYTDRTYTMVSVPEPYRGLTYIQTPNANKAQAGFPMLWFMANQAAEVCMLRDVRLPELPSWMAGFVRDGIETIKTTDTELVPYCKEFPMGLVELGGNEAGTVQASQYVVTVK